MRQHARGRVHVRIDRVPLRVRTDHQRDAAMGVDVVGAVLGVIFQHENGGLRPELAVADRFDHASQRQIVIGQIGDRRWRSDLCPRRVIVGQANDHELRHLAFGFETLSGAELIRYSSGFGADAIALLRAENSIARRTIEGGPAPSAVKRRLKELGRR